MWSMILVLGVGGVVFLGLSGSWFFWNWLNSLMKDRDMEFPFECGFDTKDSARLPFSLRFFSILIVFLVFDVELVVLLQLPLEGWLGVVGVGGVGLFLMFVFGGLVEEWRRKVLDWKK